MMLQCGLSQKAIDELLWAYENDEFPSDISDDDSRVDKNYVQPSSGSSTGKESVYPSSHKISKDMYKNTSAMM